MSILSSILSVNLSTALPTFCRGGSGSPKEKATNAEYTEFFNL